MSTANFAAQSQGRPGLSPWRYLFLLPYSASFCVFIVLPFGVSLVLSFLQYDLTTQTTARFVGFRNYTEAFGDPFFWKAVFVTTKFAVLIIPTQLVAAVLLALGMNAITRGRQTVRAAIFLPTLFSVSVAGILWQWFYNGQFGLFNYLLRRACEVLHLPLIEVPWLTQPDLAMISIVLMTLWWALGGSAVVILTSLQQIPASLFEAAAIDGAGRWKMFWQVTLPQLRPVLVFMVVINTIGAFQLFAQAMILTHGGPEMSTRGVVQLIYDTAFANYRLGYGAAISWLLFMLIAGFSLIQFLVLRRVSR